MFKGVHFNGKNQLIYTSQGTNCIIFNNSNETVILDCNKAVAQLVIQPVTYPILTEYYDEFITRKNNDWNGSTDKGEKIQ